MDAGDKVKELLDKVSYLDEESVKEIEKAAYYIIDKHKNQYRKSGEPYYIHPLEAAKILADLKLDKVSIVSALLHDVVEDTDTTLDEIRDLFGEKVATIVDGVTKIGKYEFKSKKEAEAENFRKMIVSMAKDIRVILVKLADRLHNARTFEFLRPEKQKEKAKETLEIYAPLAARLGLWRIKSELEDISFKYLYPEEYKKVETYVAQSKESQERYLREEVVPAIEKTLKEHGINAQIQYRSKHLYSIFEKTKRKGIKLSDIYDIYGIRILVDSVKDAYLTLGLIHSTYKPVPGRFKDYISLPKSNLYQALHTTVVGPKGKFVEIQIKTHDMHRIAEEGIAAHWRYKGGENLSEKDLQSFFWLKNLLDSIKKNPSSELLENVKGDLLDDEIFVFTPKGDLIKLPVGATPVDFAYAIHTQVGNRCTGAKVNGKIVPLDKPLRSGDVVEIITSKNKKPSKDWLKFVVTSKAKTSIKQYIHKQERKRAIKFGEKLLDKFLRRINKSLSSLTEKEKKLLADRFNLKTFEDLLQKVGEAKISPSKVIKTLLPSKEKEVKKNQSKTSGLSIEVDGINNILSKLASCCKPIPGDDIIGIISKGKGISIHLKDCPNIQKILENEPEKVIDVVWKTSDSGYYTANLRVISEDRPGLLADVTTAIAKTNANIQQANIKTRQDRKAINDFKIEVKDIEHLNKIISQIKKVKGVESVCRVKGCSG